MTDDKALLCISFGTSYLDTAGISISRIEEDLELEFQDRKLYRAWTSSFIRKKLLKRGIHIDSVPEALERMKNDGKKDILVQPTHMLYGEELK